MAAKKIQPAQARNALNSIRRGLEDHLGKRVTVRAQKGRRRISVDEGVLESTYPSVFTIRVNASGGPRRLSYTYSDVFTRIVRIRVNGESEEFQATPRLDRTA